MLIMLPSRTPVCCPADLLMLPFFASRVCDATTGGSTQFNMLMKLHNRQTGSDRQMQAASKEINQICERLRLPDIVKNSALEVFKDVSG